MVDLETATIQLYEDASLTEDLQDEEAKLLLKWGETQLKPLVEKYAADEATFEELFKNMRRFIKAVNRFVGRRQDAAPDEQQEMMAKVVEAAQGINPDFRTHSVNSFTQAQSAQSNTQTIESLLAWVSPETASPPAPSTSSAMPPAPVSDTPDALLPSNTETNNNKQDDEENKPDIKPLW